MRVLFITPYITSPCHPAFLRNQTGFGYMVHDIAQYVAKTEDVDVYIPTTFTPMINVDGFNILHRSKWQFIKNLKFRNLLEGFLFNRKYIQPLKSFLRSLYLFVSIGQVEPILKKYDIVHIHGCSEISYAAIKACKRQHIPFVVTLHGLNSFEKKIKLHPSLCKYERDFLKEAAENKYPVSFISSGNKDAAEAFVETKADSFCVICNGCDVEKKSTIEDIRKKYNIDSSDFVFAFVGNISENKNQIQVARAWMLLPQKVRSRCKVLFVGRYRADDELVLFISKNKLQKDLILCGIQPKDNISSYYHACNATILTSITEGFGLSIIEGFVYGKPNVTFADLPAIPDVYNNNVMTLANSRTDQALAQTMYKVINETFDASYICKYAHKFSFDNMAKHYCEAYKRIVK